VLIDVAITGDRIMIKKWAEKFLKYKDLIIEIQRMWNVRANIIPVVIEENGTISKSLRQNLNNIPGEHQIKGLQKTAILSTTHMLREVLMEKYKTYFTGEIALHVAQIVNTEQL
jgi:hypothetical protein